MINGLVADDLRHWVEDIGEEMVCEAMRRSAIDQKSYGYAKGIMQSWVKKNIKTMADVRADDVRHKNQNSYSKKPIRTEPIPEWLNDPEGYNDYEKKRGMIHLEIDQLNRITVIKQIYAALDPSHKNLMENVKRILDSNQPEEVRFRIFMVMYRHTRISLGKVSKTHYGEFLTAGTTESMWQEAKLLYRGLMAREGAAV